MPFYKKRSAVLFSLILFLMLPFYLVLAEAMHSNTYKITSDSINAGGADSSSSIYKLGDTAGEVGTGNSNSNTYYMHAGFWQMQESYIAVTIPSDLVLAPMGGINGEASEGTLVWQINTDNSAGYSMNIKTDSTPALTSGSNSFADYVPASSPDPDYNFSIDPSTSAFGFSPEGTDTSARFLNNNSSTCNTGTEETQSKCWDGLSLSPKIIAQKTVRTDPSGDAVTVRFRAESGANHIQPAGNYSAPIVVTAITL